MGEADIPAFLSVVLTTFITILYFIFFVNRLFIYFFSPLSLLKSTAAGLSAVTGAFSTDIDLSCTAAVIFIISAAVRITNHIQFGLRRFKKIFKDSACGFQKNLRSRYHLHSVHEPRLL